MSERPIQTHQDICRIIEQDQWMMGILREVRLLGLPDSWVCAGFVRTKVWDVQHGYRQRSALPDVDVVYYHHDDLREETEKALESRLQEMSPGVPWSVKNQARMHVVNSAPPYSSSFDAISNFPESATAVAVRLTETDSIELMAPWGVQDLVDLIVRPAPGYDGADPLKSHIYTRRVATKDWQTKWPKLTIISNTP
jgi:uncharacterized protein